MEQILLESSGSAVVKRLLSSKDPATQTFVKGYLSYGIALGSLKDNADVFSLGKMSVKEFEEKYRNRDSNKDIFEKYKKSSIQQAKIKSKYEYQYGNGSQEEKTQKAEESSLDDFKVDYLFIEGSKLLLRIRKTRYKFEILDQNLIKLGKRDAKNFTLSSLTASYNEDKYGKVVEEQYEVFAIPAVVKTKQQARLEKTYGEKNVEVNQHGSPSLSPELQKKIEEIYQKNREKNVESTVSKVGLNVFDKILGIKLPEGTFVKVFNDQLNITIDKADGYNHDLLKIEYNRPWRKSDKSDNHKVVLRFGAYNLEAPFDKKEVEYIKFYGEVVDKLSDKKTLDILVNSFNFIENLRDKKRNDK